MKKILLVLSAILMFSCSKDKGDKDDFFQRQVTLSELISGTGTFVLDQSSSEYLVFSESYVALFRRGASTSDSHWIAYNNCSIVGDSIYFAHTSGNVGTYSAYINLVHWGESKPGIEQILIRDGGNMPYYLKQGFYDKSTVIDLRN